MKLFTSKIIPLQHPNLRFSPSPGRVTGFVKVYGLSAIRKLSILYLKLTQNRYTLTFYVQSNPSSNRLRLKHNVWRYVALAQSRGGARFCTRGAMRGYDVVLFIVALAKTVTPGGSPRREPGQAAPQTT